MRRNYFRIGTVNLIVTEQSLYIARTENGQNRHQDFKIMNQQKAETNNAPVNHAPLFASVWLALYSELRKTYSGQRAATLAGRQLTTPRNVK